MIVSVSRRTDIPAFYAEWFYNRLAEGYALMCNPRNPQQMKRVDLREEFVDGIVFWTKNAAPMLPRLRELGRIPFYFLFTVTPYGQDIEPGIPGKFDTILPAFARLVDTIGPRRVLWRYDPILLGANFTVETHIAAFEKLAATLRGSTQKCIISFLDPCRSVTHSERTLGIRSATDEEQLLLAKALSSIAYANGIAIETCAERIDLSAYGVGHARCVDAELMGEIAGRTIPIGKDKNQRPGCGCAASVDIGMYNTCPGGCAYCYANYIHGVAKSNAGGHDPHSPLLIGQPANDFIAREKMDQPH